MYRSAGDRDADTTIERVVGEMRVAIQSELGLPASAGIAAFRPIAKMASGAAKPAGVRMVRPSDTYGFVAPLPVRKWPGIGPVAEGRLHAARILTLGQLLEVPAAAPEGALAESVRRAVFGDGSDELGRDRPAFREHDPEGLTLGSISNERTFSADVGDLQTIRDQLRALCERVCWRARQRNIRGRTITLKLRYADFETLTRSRTIEPTATDRVVFDCVRALFKKAYVKRRRVRLLGVGMSNLVDGPAAPRGQLELFEDDATEGGVCGAIDAVRDRFGYDAIRLGGNRKSSRWRSKG